MKKYLLAVLALGATMMMACEPANNGDKEPEVTPDYVFDEALFTETQSLLTPYGDYYENGTSNFYLEFAGMVAGEDGIPTSVHMLAIDYNLAATVTDGAGVINADVDGTYPAGTYAPGYVQEDYLMGSGIMVMDYATYTITNYCFVSGEISIVAKADGVYSVKGLVTCEDGKVVKLDYEGPVVFNDENGGVAPLKKGVQLKK